MKKLYIVSIFVCVISYFFSCTKEDNLFPIENEKADVELSKLYMSIDSLHAKYSDKCTSRGRTTDKWGRRILSATVDACISTLTAGTGPFGALVCGTIASGLYDDYLDHCAKKMADPPRKKVNGKELYIQAVTFADMDASFIDSIGYFHNLLLDEIKSEKVSFVDSVGNINYDACYTKVTDLARRHGVYEDFEIDKLQLFGYLESVIKTLASTEEVDQDVFMSTIFNNAYIGFGFDGNRTIQLKNICEKIIYNDLCLEGNTLIEYGAQVNEIIEKSNVSENIKTELKIANNVAVNSSLYWEH